MPEAQGDLERVRLLAADLGPVMRARGLTIATAKSCTGGLIAALLTEVPGSSDYVLGGVVSYANTAKTALLGVGADLLAEKGAVSEPVALAMADGIRRRLGADLALSVTGIAGPGGGSADKPVGTVWIGMAGPGDALSARRLHFAGDRAAVRAQASEAALAWVVAVVGGSGVREG